ncbi:translation initiation factor IF-2-like [Penaeus monodon]|uniref:translation initiation factor IF-2-like n=1 Tax=Penaeus monodon TaxID=6687 RepID=UPI0018A79DC3|nr:translation initiation factor IF-2-like [Penaeus monodon]
MVAPHNNGRLTRSLVRIPGSGSCRAAGAVYQDFSRVSGVAAMVAAQHPPPQAMMQAQHRSLSRGSSNMDAAFFRKMAANVGTLPEAAGVEIGGTEAPVGEEGGGRRPLRNPSRSCFKAPCRSGGRPSQRAHVRAARGRPNPVWNPTQAPSAPAQRGKRGGGCSASGQGAQSGVRGRARRGRRRGYFTDARPTGSRRPCADAERGSCGSGGRRRAAGGEDGRGGAPLRAQRRVHEAVAGREEPAPAGKPGPVAEGAGLPAALPEQEPAYQCAEDARPDGGVRPRGRALGLLPQARVLRVLRRCARSCQPNIAKPTYARYI